ncbi:hypothetical protein JKF63_00280 [Porcisia hertigi]|uniref:Uncharacterized protein n=1 Tax=Porcisia hertigi TaxID=2761500 RepID=A0A836KWX9_9TRYP|nr:hypothetical protein JKF63_00280 [Porcisia hertigi]
MSMFSPYDAVYGHDTTYIRRMTVEEYVQELKEEEADARGETPPPRAAGKASENTAPATPTSQPPARRTTREYEQRRMALSSCNPNVVFFSKYPMYDRLGRELCVAFQMQDMAVQQELRSLETEESRANGLGSRRSGVRLSAELPMESDTTGSNCPLSVRASAAMTEKHELAHTEASRLVRPSHMDGDTLVDIDVSATTYRPSSATIGAFSRPVSGRPSDFSIFCDSSETAAAEIKRGGLGKVRSSVPVRSAAQKEGILIHRRDSDGGLLRATSLPPAVLPRLPADADDRHSQRRWWSEKRHRTRNSGGGGRHSRVRFVNDTDDIEQEEEPPRQCARGAVPLPLRLLTPPPVPMSEAESTRVEETAVEDATRWTTASRASAAVRATKQLFRCTAHTNTSTASRATITPSYRHPIESSIYGLSATAIAASKVRAALESNVQVCAAAMSPHLYSEEEATSAETTPELQCGSVVQLGSVWYRLVHFHLVAEVYVAERIRPQVRMTAASPITKEQPREAGSPAVVGAAATAALSETAPDHRPVDNSCMLGAVENTAPKQGCSVASAVPEERLVQTSCGGGEGNGAVVASTANECVGETSSQQFFVYRWRSTNLARGADEARRAALGLSLFAPQLHVHSLRYADGGGITVLSMPPGYRAVPMSGLPLSLRSYTTLLRLLLKALSVMVARRTVHGNLSALGELFLAWPVTPEQSSSLPRTEEGKQRNDNGSGNGNGVQGAAREPLILLFHWERWVDFSMFVDRNAGRTVPFDFEDDTAASLTTYGKDVLGSLQLFLEHPLAAELTSEQYILLQKLIVMATEPTQVANLLIQMNNLMLALPIDTAALHQSFDASVMHHAR